VGGLYMVNVSVIIPCYRCADTVGRAVESISLQTLIPNEIILIDDCSGDGTLSVLREIKEQYYFLNIIIIELDENQGPGSARNKGWDIATQYYIAFLDADDTWHPKKIEIQYKWMIENHYADLSGHESKLLNSNHNPIPVKDIKDDVKCKRVTSSRLLISNCFPTRTVMLKRNINQRFLEGKRYSEDYLLWCEICIGGGVCYLINEVMAYSYKEAYGVSGLTSSLSKMHKGEIDTLFRLNKLSKIKFRTLIVLLVFLKIKYIRRVLNVSLR
jgi:glycosyltransferase involved in cell wall biosynthesis